MKSIKDHSPFGAAQRNQAKHILAALTLLMVVSLACNLPFSKKSILPGTATPQTPTSEPVELPPTVIETSPLPGSTLPLQGGIELIFDKPMERETVEGAIQLEPAYSGRFEWEDDSAVRFIPDQPLPVDTAVRLTVAETARDQQGNSLLRQLSFSYQTAGSLHIAERFPANGLEDVDPGSTVAVTFTQPIVPLGESETALPDAFTIQPSVRGVGRWLNSSTYLFEPELSLGGGVTYTLSIDPELTSLAGSGLDETEQLTWTFHTAPPQITYVDPPASNIIWLDDEFTVHFNQAMDRRSVEENWFLVTPDGSSVRGTYRWDDSNQQVIFKPDELLPRGSLFELTVGRETRSYGGTRLGADWRHQFQTAGKFLIDHTDPAPGSGISTYSGYGNIQVLFTAPLAKGQDLGALVRLEPEPVDFHRSLSGEGDRLYLDGYLESDQEYRLIISGDLKDRWGETLGENFTESYHLADIDPTLTIPMIYASHQVIYLPAGETLLPAAATNIRSLSVKYSPVSLEEMLRVYQNRYELGDFLAESAWTQYLNLPLNVSQPIEIGLSTDGSTLPPGVYRYRISSVDLDSRWANFDFWLVVSQAQMALKVSDDEAFVWATSLGDWSGLSSQTVVVYNQDYQKLGEGVTDEDGIAIVALTPGEDRNTSITAVLNSPGDANFSIGYSFWDDGISLYDFDLPYAYSQSDLKTYFMSDRPIYRPGQTIYFKGFLRTPDDARYLPPNLEMMTVDLMGEYIPESESYPLIGSVQAPVSDYGTIHGEFTLPEDAPPGDYTLRDHESGHYLLNIQVADYRKPEIDLRVTFDKTEAVRGDPLHVDIAASYFFGGPAKNAKLTWSLYAQDQFLSIPEGYHAGLVDTSWLQPNWDMGFPNPLGKYLTGGEGTTDDDGLLPVTFTPEQLDELLKDPTLVKLTLEATLIDETNLMVSQRGSVTLHPSDFYIGIRKESWGQPAGTPMGFSIQTVNWEAQPSGLHTLSASFQKVVWKQDFTSSMSGEILYSKELTNISGSGFRTDASGRARLEFTPPEPGTYQLEIRGEGAVSQTLIWVGGSGSIAWPRLPNQHLRIESDKQTYTAGETANIFIPNPYEDGAKALVTVERTGVIYTQLLDINASSQIVELELGENYAPNVFVSVLLLGNGDRGQPDFRLGYLQLDVDPSFLVLQVDLIPEKDRLEPGETARAEIRVHDSQDNPVQGEFTLAVVDAAIYALAKSNSADIREAFYGTQLLRVRNGISLAAYSSRISLHPPPMGGGGGGGFEQARPVLRSDYRDTAYWNASIQTDANGRALVEFQVPDNLTTWVMTLRGTTLDTKVGETVVKILATKDLLVRPVTPRFLVSGDRVKLGAVVHNNTAQDMVVKVGLLAAGVAPEEPDQLEQTLQLKAGTNQRVDWWVKVLNAEKADLVFSAAGGGFEDSTTPPQGALPILRYSTPATFATSGVLGEAGDVLEVVSLPRSFTPTGGQLSLEMSSTLAGTVLRGLEAMETFPSNFSESVISRLFANLAVYNLLRETSFDSPDLEAKLQGEIRKGIDHLFFLQNMDGGWGWSSGMKSDLYLSSYALLSLGRADAAGFTVAKEKVSSASDYVNNAMFQASTVRENWELDRLAFAKFALDQAGGVRVNVDDLYDLRDRLSPWGKALLSLSLESNDSRTSVLISDLQASALRSATGAFWQDPADKWFNHASPLATTAMVVYALAERDPASEVLTESVRYLTMHRRANGCWDSTYDSAWGILALSRVLRATGDLQSDFAYSASVNDVTIASGQAAGIESITPVSAAVNINELNQNHGNALIFQRDEGPGRLYYRAFLQVDAPVEAVQVLDRGIRISRSYQVSGAVCAREDCPTIDEIELGEIAPVLLAHVAVTLPYDMYDLVVEDFIPAGMEVINTHLLSSQLGIPDSRVESYNPIDIESNGWGWWYFSGPAVYDDHVRWVASYAPAGTYILTYRLQPLQAGEFRVIPAHAYAYYFPEVEGRSAGAMFTIKE